MTTTNIFEFATRQGLRFPYKGSQSTEELWRLPVTELDKVFKTLNTQMKETHEESLLNVKTKEDEELEVKIAIVKHIVAVKLAEQEKRKTAIENKAKAQKIMEIMEKRKEVALENASDEELQKMLSELDV